MGSNKSKTMKVTTPPKEDTKKKSSTSDGVQEAKSHGGKLIVVFGATGAQGGSLVRAIIKDHHFRVKGVTRNLAGEKAQELTKLGVEMVEGDADDADSLQRATEGAYGVFIVTNYWEHYSKEKEIQQGKNMVDACKANDVSHVVFSGLENVQEAIGKPCPPFDSKAEVEEYIKTQGLHYTLVHYGFYCENLLTLMKPSKKGDVYELGMPMGDVVLPMVSVTDSGACIVQILKDHKKYKGSTIGLCSEKMTVPQYADALNALYDGTYKFAATELTPDEFSLLGFPGAEELGAAFEFFKSEKADRDINLTRKLNSHMPTFVEWVSQHKDELAGALEES